MWTLLLVVFVTGSPALLQAAPVQGHGGRCSFAGVFHAEGSSRYSLTSQQALVLCQSLGYKLATQEQVTEAYKKGLRTCRYGWIDGQNVMFLPHVNGPNCESSSAEVTVQPKAAEYLSDVYCFNSDSSLNCEDTVKSEGLMNGNTGTENGTPHEDILTEFKTEGFLVDLEEILGRVKRETSPLSDTEIPKTDTKPSTVPTLEEPSTITNHEDTNDPTSKPHFVKSSSTFSPSILFFDTDGSGSGIDFETTSKAPEPSQFTTRLITTEAAESTSIQNDIEEILLTPAAKVPEVKSHGGSKTRRVDVGETPNSNPPSSSHHGEGPSTWLVIFGFCVVVGAIVCLLVAFATRDKWYGPRTSRNITTEENNKNYSKSETLPLSEKEQEIVALMSSTNMKNGNTVDITATSLDEREKEYLM